MLQLRQFSLLILVLLSLAPVSSLAGRIITVELNNNPLINMRVERVLERHNYKVAHKSSNGRKIELVATNDRDSQISPDLIIDLGFHSTFIGIKEPTGKTEYVPLQIYLQDSITREMYVQILSSIQAMGIHVSSAKSQKHAHFFLKVPRDKMSLFVETFRKNPLFDLYYVLGASPSTEFFQDYRRNGVTDVEIAFVKAGTHESILADIPPHIAAVSVMKHQTAEELKAEGEDAPQGGVTTITLPRKYAYVGAMIRSLEQYRSEKLIKIYPGDDYYEAKGDDSESFIIDPNARRFVLEPRSDRLWEVALKLPDIEERINQLRGQLHTDRNVAILYAGLSAMVERAFHMPIDTYGHARGTNAQGGMTEFIYVEIPKHSMIPDLLEDVLRDYHLYPLHNDGTPNRNEEIQAMGQPACDDLLTAKPKPTPKP